MLNVDSLTNPLFIIGSPRSGTSLIRLIMTSHSQIVVPPECGFIVWLSNEYGNWDKNDCSDVGRVNSFVDDLLECKKFDTWGLNRSDVSGQILELQPESYSELCTVVYKSFADSIGQNFSIWGDKNNFYLNYLEELQSLYPKAKFLHIVRDGRDIVCSYREVMESKSNSPYAPKLSTNVSEIAEEWMNNVLKVDSFMSHVPAHMGKTIRYEDLTSRPSDVTQEICSWLNLPFEEEMLNFYKQNKKSSLEPNLTMDWKKRTLEPVSNDTVNRYLRLMSDVEKNEFIMVAEVALRAFCYKI